MKRPFSPSVPVLTNQCDGVSVEGLQCVLTACHAEMHRDTRGIKFASGFRRYASDECDAHKECVLNRGHIGTCEFVKADDIDRCTERYTSSEMPTKRCTQKIGHIGYHLTEDGTDFASFNMCNVTDLAGDRCSFKGDHCGPHRTVGGGYFSTPADRCPAVSADGNRCRFKAEHKGCHHDDDDAWRDGPAPVVGTKADEGKMDYTLIPWDGMDPVVRVLMFGEKKYSKFGACDCGISGDGQHLNFCRSLRVVSTGRDNWRNVDRSTIRYTKALMRHVVDHLRGEEKDPESGESHLAHVVCCAIFLLGKRTKP